MTVGFSIILKGQVIEISTLLTKVLHNFLAAYKFIKLLNFI